MHLLLFEPRVTGHHLVFVKHLARDSVPLVDRVTVVLPKGADASAEFQNHLLPLADKVDFRCELDGRFIASSLSWGRKLLSELDRAVTSARPDHIWLPSGDVLATFGGFARLAHAWRLPAGVEAECGLVYSALHLRSNSLTQSLCRGLQRHLLAASPWTRLLTNDFLLHDGLRQRSPFFAQRLGLFPDPIDAHDTSSKWQARRNLRIPEDGRIIGTAGSFASNPRKGACVLARAFARMPRRPGDRLLLAGRLSPELRRALEQEFGSLLAKEELLLLDRYLSDAELHQSLAAMDVVCVPYQAHTGLSAIALRSARVQRPILATNSGWLGAVVPRFGLGRLITSFELDYFARDIRESLDTADDYRPTPRAKKLLDYCAVENFSRSWQTLIRQRLGMGQDPRLLDWDHVITPNIPPRPLSPSMVR